MHRDLILLCSQIQLPPPFLHRFRSSLCSHIDAARDLGSAHMLACLAPPHCTLSVHSNYLTLTCCAQNDQGGANGHSQDLRNVYLELLILMQVNHPNVVAFYGMSTYFPEDEYDDSDFHLGFVFELCSEGSLYANLHELGVQFSFESKLRILREVATGMSYLHQQNIIHRDLSSRNILLTEDYSVKIADFGCARKLQGDSYDSSTISGSPSYMPPEQLRGDVLTLSVDVWAFGTMTWETVCGKVPWRSQIGVDPLESLREKVVTKGERLPNPTEDSVPPGSHGPLVKLLKSTFEKKPALRSNMSQVLDQLTAIKDVVCLADWAPSDWAPTRKRVDALQASMGPAQLETRLQVFYKIFNPSKLRDVKLVAKNFKDNQIKLNENLRSRYSYDLWDMDAPSAGVPQSTMSSIEAQVAVDKGGFLGVGAATGQVGPGGRAGLQLSSAMSVGTTGSPTAHMQSLLPVHNNFLNSGLEASS